MLVPAIALGAIFSFLLIFSSDIAIKVKGEKYRLSRRTFLLISAAAALIMGIALLIAEQDKLYFVWDLLMALSFFMVCLGASFLLPSKAQIAKDPQH